MKRVTAGIVLGIVWLVGVSLLAQSPTGVGQAASNRVPAANGFTNLQVWPKDTPRAVILQFMDAFGDSLGVGCDYCHVRRDGKLDFASDDKREKKVARQMILLRDSINVALPAIVGKPPGIGPTSGQGHPGAPVRVLCSSCHRGLPIPKSIGEVISEAAANAGSSVGLAKFKELRAQYYGGQQYDFSEVALLGIARRALDTKKPNDAMAYLQANLEYYPKSSRTYQAMAQVKVTTGDKAGAIRDLEKALELNPNNTPARNQLQQLKGQ